jgi:ABC-type transporter Mla subunit MlaD
VELIDSLYPTSCELNETSKHADTLRQKIITALPRVGDVQSQLIQRANEIETWKDADIQAELEAALAELNGYASTLRQHLSQSQHTYTMKQAQLRQLESELAMKQSRLQVLELTPPAYQAEYDRVDLDRKNLCREYVQDYKAFAYLSLTNQHYQDSIRNQHAPNDIHE